MVVSLSPFTRKKSILPNDVFVCACAAFSLLFLDQLQPPPCPSVPASPSPHPSLFLFQKATANTLFPSPFPPLPLFTPPPPPPCLSVPVFPRSHHISSVSILLSLTDLTLPRSSLLFSLFHPTPSAGYSIGLVPFLRSFVRFEGKRGEEVP